MKLQRREIATILIGAAIVLVAWLLHAAPSRAGASGDSIGSLLATVRNYQDVQERVQELVNRLHVTLPTTGPAEQEVRVREALGRLAQSNGMQLGALKRLDRASRLASAQAALDFQLELNGQYEQLIRFINALENDSMPFQVAELRIEAGQPQGGGGGQPDGGARPGRGGGGGGGERQRNGSIRSSMKVRGYVFPQVFLEEKKKEQPERETSGNRVGPTTTPEATPPPQATPAAVKGESKATATPTLEVKVAPKPPTNPTQQNMKIVHFYGQAVPVPEENVDQFIKNLNLPEGAEVTVE